MRKRDLWRLTSDVQKLIDAARDARSLMDWYNQESDPAVDKVVRRIDKALEPFSEWQAP